MPCAYMRVQILDLTKEVDKMEEIGIGSHHLEHWFFLTGRIQFYTNLLEIGK